MIRVDTSRPVRALAAGVFTFEAAALIESLLSESRRRPPRFPTISAGVWRHPKAIPVVCAALAVHLYLAPPAA